MNIGKYSSDDVENRDKNEVVSFEDAVSMAGKGKFHYMLLFVCGIGQIALVFELYLSSYLLPAAQCDFQMTAQEKGLLNSISYAGVILSSPLWGFLADTQGRKKILIISLVCDGIIGVLSSLAPNYSTLLAFRFFNGFFICSPGAVVYAYVGEFYNNIDRPTAIVLVSVFLPIGTLALPGLAWGVIPQTWVVTLPWCSFNSWRIFVVCCAIPSLMGGIIVYLCLPESPKFLMNQGKKEEALKILRHVFVVNTGKDPGDYMVKSIKEDNSAESNTSNNLPNNSCLNIIKNIWSQTAPLFQRQHILMTLLVCSLQFGYYTCFNSLLLWLPEMFNNMAAYTLFHDGQTATVCESMRAFVESTVDETLYQYFPGNRSIWNYESNSFTNNSYLIDDIILNNPSYGNQTEIAECDSTITPETFRNTLIIGGGTGAINLIIGFVVRWTGRKVIGFVFMGVAAGSCIGLDFGQTSEIVLVLAFLFVCLTGVSSSLLNSAVVDIFPTQLRLKKVMSGCHGNHPVTHAELGGAVEQARHTEFVNIRALYVTR
uniref:Major facilitator superfamily (MFS) profile domain-containing protein n=1 Tax=Timema tahoe TaxID=61484 RepID=A0A7R9IMU1_9NEOP|nr:unnamed protein product [Timema tahoe]